MSKFYFSDFIKGNSNFFDSFGNNVHQTQTTKTKGDKIKEIQDRQEVVQNFINEYGLMPDDLDGIRESDLSIKQKQRLFQTLYLLSSQATLGVEPAQKTVISSFLLSEDIKPYLAGIDLSRIEATSQNLANGVFVKSGIESAVSKVSDLNAYDAVIERSFGFKDAFRGVIDAREGILNSNEALEYILSSEPELISGQEPLISHLTQYVDANPNSSAEKLFSSIDDYISIQQNSKEATLNQLLQTTGFSEKSDLISTLAFIKETLPENAEGTTDSLKASLNKIIPPETEPKLFEDFAFLDGSSSITNGDMSEIGVISGKIERKDLFDESSRDFEAEVNKILSENNFSIVKVAKFGDKISTRAIDEAAITNQLAQDREEKFSKASPQGEPEIIQKSIKDENDERIAREKSEEFRKIEEANSNNTPSKIAASAALTTGATAKAVSSEPVKGGVFDTLNKIIANRIERKTFGLVKVGNLYDKNGVDLKSFTKPIVDTNPTEKASLNDVKVQGVEQESPDVNKVEPNAPKVGTAEPEAPSENDPTITPDGAIKKTKSKALDEPEADSETLGNKVLGGLKSAAIKGMDKYQSGKGVARKLLESNESVIKNEKGHELLNLKSGGALAKLIGKENTSLRATFKKDGFQDPNVHKVAALKVKQAGIKKPCIVLPTAKGITQEQKLEFFKHAYKSLREAGFDADNISNTFTNRALKQQIAAAKSEIEEQIIADEINRASEFGGILNEAEGALLKSDDPSLTEDELNTLEEMHPLENDGVELAEGINPEENVENNMGHDVAIAEGVTHDAPEVSNDSEVSGFSYDSSKTSEIKQAQEPEVAKEDASENKRTQKVTHKM